MPLRTKLAWIAALYFAEGLPFGIVADALPVWLRVHGAGLAEIGMLSLLGLPWTLKVLWAPLVDRFGSHQAWIVPCLGVAALVLYLLPFADAAQPGPLLWGLLLLLTLASATQDVAIDAYTVGLAGPGEEGPANGVRVAAYRAALVAAGGGLLLASGVLGWTGAFHLAAGLCVVLALLLGRSPRLAPPAAAERRGQVAALRAWLALPGSAVLVAFVLTFKLGDAAMGPMVRPFWVDRGLTVAEIGLITNTLGVALTVAGALAGGWLTSRLGIVAALFWLGLAQALSNLGYAAAALVDAGRAGIYAASMLESFTGGLGTAAFLSLLMGACDRRHAAVQYAFLSALFGLTRSLAGALSGWATTELGYAAYFGLTFVLALPAFALLPALRLRLRAGAAAAVTAC